MFSRNQRSKEPSSNVQPEPTVDVRSGSQLQSGCTEYLDLQSAKIVVYKALLCFNRIVEHENRPRDPCENRPHDPLEILEEKHALVALVHQQVEDAQVGEEAVFLFEHLVVSAWCE